MGRDYTSTPQKISIHAPREGSDALGRAPPPVKVISIHAPREGSDNGEGLYIHSPKDFNPRSPRGERPSFGITIISKSPFQSTLPARGATF